MLFYTIRCKLTTANWTWNSVFCIVCWIFIIFNRLCSSWCIETLLTHNTLWWSKFSCYIVLWPTWFIFRCIVNNNLWSLLYLFYLRHLGRFWLLLNTWLYINLFNSCRCLCLTLPLTFLPTLSGMLEKFRCWVSFKAEWALNVWHIESCLRSGEIYRYLIISGVISWSLSLLLIAVFIVI